jgi:putative redox protein
MATATVTYLGELRTQATHLLSGNELLTDAPLDNQGRGEAFSPTDLLATSLGTCMVTIMGIAAREHGFPLEGTRLEITKVMASNPRRVAEVIVEFYFPPISYSEKQKRILEKAATTCPSSLSLHPDLKQTIHFHFQE